jgi:hypothetical protein
MDKVSIKLPSWVAVAIDPKASDWLTLEKEIGIGATANDLLTALATTNPGFREAVFNPDTGVIIEQINVILNDKLLTYQEITQLKLTDGDILMLLPIYFGG